MKIGNLEEEEEDLALVNDRYCQSPEAPGKVCWKSLTVGNQRERLTALTTGGPGAKAEEGENQKETSGEGHHC